MKGCFYASVMNDQNPIEDPKNQKKKIPKAVYIVVFIIGIILLIPTLLIGLVSFTC